MSINKKKSWVGALLGLIGLCLILFFIPKGLKTAPKNKPGVANNSSESVLKFNLVHKQNNEWIQELSKTQKAPHGYKRGHDRSVKKLVYYVRDSNVPSTEINASQLKNFFHKPADFMLMQMSQQNGSKIYVPYFIERKTRLSGFYIKTAFANTDRMGGAFISIEMNEEGTKKFAALTKKYASNDEENRRGRQLAIILGDTLYSAPVIRCPINSGRAEICGTFTKEETERLVTVLQTEIASTDQKRSKEHSKTTP